MLRALAVGAALALAVGALASCDDEQTAEESDAGPTAATPETRELRDRPPDAAVSGIECPKQIRISDRSRCALIARRTKLTDCPKTRIGHDLSVSGVPCAEAYGLMGPLGSAGLPALGNYSKSRVVLYRPAVATYQRPFEIRPTGWTCSAIWEKHSTSGVQLMCWRGKAVLTFQFSG